MSGLPVGEGDGSTHVPTFDDREVAQERPLAVLGAEARFRAGNRSGSRSSRIVCCAVRHRNEPPVRPQDAPQLEERPVEVRARDRASRRRPRSRRSRRGTGGSARRRPPPPHPARAVSSTIRSDWSTATTRAPSSRCIRSASSPRPGPTSRIEPRLGLCDRLERDLARVRAGGVLLRGDPRREAGSRRRTRARRPRDRSSGSTPSAFTNRLAPRTTALLSPLYSTSSLTARRSAVRANGVRAPCRPARS